MKRFADAVQRSLDSDNWYGALMIALTLPDVCGRLENPKDGVGKRYRRWFESFVQHRYTMDGGGHIFLSGDDCYALRCSYLHEGSGDITNQVARKALDSFHFIEPPGNGNVFHKIQNNNVLLLQIDLFCKDMLDGVTAWEKTVWANGTVFQQKLALLKIHDVSGGFSF